MINVYLYIQISFSPKASHTYNGVSKPGTVRNWPIEGYFRNNQGRLMRFFLFIFKIFGSLPRFARDPFNQLEITWESKIQWISSLMRYY